MQDGDGLPADFKDTPITESAHGTCRTVERYLKERLEKASGSEATVLTKMLINVRILGRLLEFCPTQAGKEAVARAITSALLEGEEYLGTPEFIAKLSELGGHYDKYFIRTFRKAKGATPQSSEHPSRPSFDCKSELIKEWLVPYPKDHRAAKRSALVRDNFRCIISGRLDSNADDFIDAEDGDATIERTECAHIFSEPTNSNSNDAEMADYASKACTILQTFGYPEIRKELEGHSVHRLSNIMTLSATIRDWFDNLKLWLQPTIVPNVYNVETREDHDRKVFHRYKVPRQVTLTTRDPQLDLPDPKYLGLHSACCRIAHLSGAADYLDKMDRDNHPSSLISLNQEFTDILTARLFDLQTSHQLVEVSA
ncbi:hypothetical protein BT69DRAFT_1077769 [Atractiella rhizophila]|nr:hypothetical protein BT69DRAFT_1077769 [Atractiella rhizophila]